MSNRETELFSAPWLLGTACLLLLTAIVEKALNLVGGSIPVIQVFPRQVLDWAVVIAIFEIAFTLRHLYERERE